MNRYFDLSHLSSFKHKVVVFPNGKPPGRSYWSSDAAPSKSLTRWTLANMKALGNKEISRAVARRLIKNIP